MPSPRFELPLPAVLDLLLELARERELEARLERLVGALAALPDVALARIWMVRPGDVCKDCPLRSECPTHVPCLHLAASAGAPRADPEADWSRLTGDFRRIPLGRRKVGSIAAAAEAIRVEDARCDSRWIARPEWARREGIAGFGGQPLVHRGAVLGVLGLFTRTPFGDEALATLRTLADHAAAAVAQAHAFDEIARLKQQLETENEVLRDELCEGGEAGGRILGSSAALRRIDEQIAQVAPTDAGVLIFGETGTGKELVAREIHRRSRRAGRPLIRVNCAAVPRDLFESEFFGHAAGAFTGALRERLGRFAAADGGTLFLDEVAEIPLELQPKLLRVLQEGQYERVGEERARSADVRIVAATNRPLGREVAAGRFRQDLLYRLEVFPIEVPPLRKRPEDIPLLAEHFLARANRRHKRRARLGEAELEALRAYEWPGNVRELQNAIERAVITARGRRLALHLPVADTPDRPTEASAPRAGRILRDAEIRRIDRDNLVAALEACRWKVQGPGGVAERLGLKPTTVASRIQRLGLRRGRTDPGEPG